ncbi:MAG: hypothetical protein ACKVP0_21620 [Pirellulaceae bacterium]
MNEQPPRPDDEAGEPFRLRPLDCNSRQEKLHELEPLPALTVAPIPAAPPFQFTVFDLMIVMIGVAGGLAGGTWMPADIFAAILGLVTLLGLVLVHFFPPESHFARLVWGTLVLSYVIAVAAAIVNGN